MGAEPIGSFGEYPKKTFSVPAAVRSAAKQGLSLGKKYGTPTYHERSKVGRHRARQLANGSPRVTLRDIVYIRSYLRRHKQDIRGVKLNPTKPTNGWISWLYWGGTPAVKWVETIYRKYVGSEGATAAECPCGQACSAESTGSRKAGAALIESAKVDPLKAYDEYNGAKGLLVRAAILPVHPEADRPEVQLTDTQDVYDLLHHLAWADREHMVVISMDNGNRVLAIDEAAVGGVSSVSQSWPLLFRVPLLTGATRVILAHNHPGGTTGREKAAQPSKTDKKLAKQASKAFERVGLDLVDVVIISADSYASLLKDA